MSLRCAFGLVLLAGACAAPGIKVVRMSDGTRELTCDMPLWKCIARVDDYCKGASFEVLYAHDKQHLYGAPGAEVESRTSSAVIHCLGLHSKLTDAASTVPPPSSAAPPPVRPSPAPPPAVASPAASPQSAPARACVPGATQVCVGPGACSGGQSCLADGSGFSPCDCGAAPAVTAPAPAPPK